MAKRGQFYINNVDFLQDIKDYRHTGKVSTSLAEKLILLARRTGSHRSFRGYTFNDDMVQAGVLQCLVKLDCFDPDKGSNPFGYFTQILWNVFRQCLNSEKRQYDIRDELLIAAECNPSFSYEDRHNMELNS